MTQPINHPETIQPDAYASAYSASSSSFLCGAYARLKVMLATLRVFDWEVVFRPKREHQQPVTLLVLREIENEPGIPLEETSGMVSLGFTPFHLGSFAAYLAAARKKEKKTKKNAARGFPAAADRLICWAPAPLARRLQWSFPLSQAEPMGAMGLIGVNQKAGPFPLACLP